MRFILSGRRPICWGAWVMLVQCILPVILLISPRIISSSNIILRNSFHQEAYPAVTLISFVGVAAWHIITYVTNRTNTTKVWHHGVDMDQWISLLCGACAAAGCALPLSHLTTRAFRFPCSACAAVGCALPCCIRLPITIAALQCMIFFFYGLTCSYRFMFFLWTGNFRPRLVMWPSCRLMWCVFSLLCYITSCNVLSCDALPSDSLSQMFPWHHTSHTTTSPHSFNARRNKNRFPTSPNTAPATQKLQVLAPTGLTREQLHFFLTSIDRILSCKGDTKDWITKKWRKKGRHPLVLTWGMLSCT